MSKDEDCLKVEPRVITEMPDVTIPRRPDYPSSEFGKQANVGWVCPKCGTCWNPRVDFCECLEDKPREVIEKDV